jgi:hypothetical protein
VQTESPASANEPLVDIPSMETVYFHDSVSPPFLVGLGSFITNVNPPVVNGEPTTDSDFDNTSQGASPCSMQAGVIPSSPGEFAQLMTKPLQLAALASSPIRRRFPRQTYSTSTVPRGSSRLAKKARRRVPIVATVQNLLMWKLRLSTSAHVESNDFDCYLRAFKECLMEE